MFAYDNGVMSAQVYSAAATCKGDFSAVTMLDGCQSGSEAHAGYSSQWCVGASGGNRVSFPLTPLCPHLHPPTHPPANKKLKKTGSTQTIWTLLRPSTHRPRPRTKNPRPNAPRRAIKNRKNNSKPSPLDLEKTLHEEKLKTFSVPFLASVLFMSCLLVCTRSSIESYVSMKTTIENL